MMTPQPLLTHIITGLNVGGAERALHTLLTNGLEGPFRNRVISLMGPGHYGPLLEQAGIPLTCLNMPRGLPTPGALWRLRVALRHDRPALVQGWMYHGNLAASLAGWLAGRGVPVAWNVRASLQALRAEKPTTRAAIRLGARLSRGPKAILYNSARSLTQHREIGYADGADVVIPNGFDTDTWRSDAAARAQGRQNLGLGPDEVVIGYVGRGHPQKDIPLLAGAFDQVRRLRPTARLICIGREIDMQVPADCSRDGMQFLGQRADVPVLLPGFDVLCLSSRSEGFPNVIGEAMACGVPCVTTDVGDAADVVGDTGWVVPPGDGTALARALGAALDTPPDELRKRGAAARGRIERDFSIAAIVSQYVALYTGLTTVDR
jgi:glycosyltransferase involved in cell wall biosynthesis